MTAAIKIKAGEAASKFVAVDGRHRSKVLAEARTAKAVIQKAEKTGRPFSVMYVPAKGETYVF